MRVTGSLAFVAAARAAYLVAQDPEDPARRFFLPMENNIGPANCGGNGTCSRSVARQKPVDPNRPTTTLKSAWTAVRATAAVECRFHDLRHTAITPFG